MRPILCALEENKIGLTVWTPTWLPAPALTRDGGRERRLLIAGYRVIQVTWAQLHDAAERRALAADLGVVLSARIDSLAPQGPLNV